MQWARLKLSRHCLQCELGDVLKDVERLNFRKCLPSIKSSWYGSSYSTSQLHMAHWVTGACLWGNTALSVRSYEQPNPCAPTWVLMSQHSNTQVERSCKYLDVHPSKASKWVTRCNKHITPPPHVECTLVVYDI